jgi:hypothetical protein
MVPAAGRGAVGGAGLSLDAAEEEMMMLTDEQKAILGVDKDKHLLYLAGIDKATWGEYSVGEGYGWVMYLLGRLATALLERNAARDVLGKLRSYAVHQPMCTMVTSVTDHCSCGLHDTLRKLAANLPEPQ